jgi:hypothetical protein
MMPGRPAPRRSAKFHFIATQRRCQRNRVSGETMVSSSSRALRPTALALRARRARSAALNRIRFPRRRSLSKAALGLEKLDDEQLTLMDPARHNHQQKRQ